MPSLSPPGASTTGRGVARAAAPGGLSSLTPRSSPEARRPHAAGAAPEPGRKADSRRLKLGHLLFLCLLLSGIIPLAISSALLIQQNRGLLVEQERRFLAQSAASLSQGLEGRLGALRRQIQQCGEAFAAMPGPAAVAERLRQPWIQDYLGTCLEHGELEVLRLLDAVGAGPTARRAELSPQADAELVAAFQAVRARPVPYFALARALRGDPLAVAAVPITTAGDAAAGEPPATLVIEATARLPLGEALADQGGSAAVYLVDSSGRLLWANLHGERLREAVAASGLLADAGKSPDSFTQAFTASFEGGRRELQMTVSRIRLTGWSVAVVKPTIAASAAVDRMIYNTLLSSLVLVALALLFAVTVSRKIGEPLHRLTATTAEIAAGNFGHRVEVGGLAFEMADLAEHFNRMSATLESYIDQLRRAAAANRELFIGSIRAFAAAIDAKDPYTRGHSERVAALSRAVARHLGYDEEFQQRVWLGALLHDVGKIGVDDRILKKGELLTAEEYEQMKLHTVIGAEIMGRIEQLKEIVPAIRWHHEAWNGRGYPDALKSEQIPLIARIVSVADTFDAVTTTRPYQQAYTPEFAVETIKKLAGTRFDAKVVTAFLSAFHAGQVESAIQRPPGPSEEMRVSAAMLA